MNRTDQNPLAALHAATGWRQSGRRYATRPGRTFGPMTFYATTALLPHGSPWSRRSYTGGYDACTLDWFPQVRM